MGNVSYALKWFKISTNFLSLVPMQLCDMHFISGKIDQDEFLAVLYQRDFDIENETYFPTYPMADHAEELFQTIKCMPFNELRKRLIDHSQLLQSFRHFMILRMEPTKEQTDGVEIPSVLQKNVIIKRYKRGESIASQQQLCKMHFI